MTWRYDRSEKWPFHFTYTVIFKSSSLKNIISFAGGGVLLRGKHFWAIRPCASCRFLVHDKKNMVKGWKTISIGTFCRGVGVRMVRNIINFPCSSSLWWLIRVSSSSWLQFLKMCENCNWLLKEILFFFTCISLVWLFYGMMIVGWLFGQCGILRPVMKKRRPRFFWWTQKSLQSPRHEHYWILYRCLFLASLKSIL